MTDTIRVAAFKGEGKLVIEDRPIPKVTAPGDVPLAVKGVGVCGTDLHTLEVPPRMPAAVDIILGHEFCGGFIEVGSRVTGAKVGDRCAVDQSAPCRHCAWIREKRIPFDPLSTRAPTYPLAGTPGRSCSSSSPLRIAQGCLPTPVYPQSS